MTQICLHSYVAGLVQGVYYRDSTQRKAKELNLTGWVRNLADGRVEVLACGEETAVRALEQWLWQGPPRAKVDNLISTVQDWQLLVDFKVVS